MLIDTKKLHMPGKGHKKIVKKEPKAKEERDPKLFYYDSQEMWLLKDDKEYKTKRKPYQKRK